jgi:hypothetical protein
MKKMDCFTAAPFAMTVNGAAMTMDGTCCDGERMYATV